MIKNVLLFICNSFFPMKRFCWWWVQTIHYIWKQNTMLGPVMLNENRKKSKRIQGKGSRAADGAKAKMQQESWKSLLMEHNELPWNQTCCSPFSYPWTDTHWCHRRCCSHVCSPYTNISECSTFFFFLPGPEVFIGKGHWGLWLVQGVWILKYHAHKRLSSPTHSLKTPGRLSG